MEFLPEFVQVGNIFGQKCTFSAELNILFLAGKLLLCNWQDIKKICCLFFKGLQNLLKLFNGSLDLLNCMPVFLIDCLGIFKYTENAFESP